MTAKTKKEAMLARDTYEKQKTLREIEEETKATELPVFKKGDRVEIILDSGEKERLLVVEGPYPYKHGVTAPEVPSYSVKNINGGRIMIARAADLREAPSIYKVTVTTDDGMLLDTYEIEYPNPSFITGADRALRGVCECVSRNIAEEIEKHAASKVQAVPK